jgi:hypothetical protein
MNFTLRDLRPTEVTSGLAGSSFNSTHLIRTYGVDKPHDLSANAQNIAMMFAGTDRYNDKPYVGMLEGKGKKLALSSRDYTWKLTGHMKQKATVVEVLETTDRPGQNFQEFKVVLDTDQYKYPDVLIGENEDYPVEIVGKAERAGLGYIYTFVIQTDDPALYFPVDLLQVGKRFHKVSTSVADEMNQDYGTIQFNTIFELRSQMGNVAEELQFTDKALRVDKNSGDQVQVLKHWRVPYLDNQGKTYYNFMPLAEAEMWNQIYADIEWGLVFGKSSTRQVKGYLKKTGPGLRQQLDSSNKLYHNGNLTLIRLEEFLSSIYRGRTDANPSQRKVTLDTGEMGALLFDRMVASEASSFTTVDSYFISGKDPRYLSYGAQYTHYRGKNGLDVTVMLNPGKDNSDISTNMHPRYPNIPVNSWRMDILDLGTTRNYDGDIKDNMQMVCEKFADYYYVSTGKWDKKTGMPITDGGEGNSAIGGYTCKVEKSFGLMIRDRSRMAVIDIKFDV